MLLWIMSDLHLESTNGWDLPASDARPPFDAMIMAGDLVPRMERGVAWLRQRVTDKPVIYTAGNHEFYGCDIDRTVDKARRLAVGTNVHVLQNDTVIIGGVLFVGCTLWTNFTLFGNADLAMRQAAEGLNDYRRIRKRRYVERLRPIDTLRRHLESRAFIASATREARSSHTVVVSHHGSVREAIRAGAENDILSAAYTSDCRELLQHVDLWVYGHTHEHRDFTVGRTRVVSNAKGYGPWRPGERWDNPNFDPNWVIEI
ncbi:metallophosphoesterase [Bradyrhizobium japonicum]|uniref:metallophosphoesterase n=1 Tax=Bradyrhizobium japonicum TaxID=375 RepID=UPI001BA60FC3|nr:metallophosphoesterase [Bradyrhizobium japonicum]MBR0804339.1 metallophosphoesterase [Bradyrhizobium japonicum]